MACGEHDRGRAITAETVMALHPARQDAAPAHPECDAALSPGRRRANIGNGSRVRDSAIGKIVVSGTPYSRVRGLSPDLCVGNVLKLGETSLADTIDLASNRPRELLVCRRGASKSANRRSLILFDAAPHATFACAPRWSAINSEPS